MKVQLAADNMDIIMELLCKVKADVRYLRCTFIQSLLWKLILFVVQFSFFSNQFQMAFSFKEFDVIFHFQAN